MRRIVHRQDDSLSCRAGVEVAADEVDRGQELAEALERVVLALQRDEHAVSGRERVHGEQPQ